jgi:hypothetical protein
MPTAVAILGAVALLASCAGSSEAPSAPPTSAPQLRSAALTPVTARAVAAPIPVPATDGKEHLAYELQLANVLGQELTMTSLSVIAGDKTLLNLSGDTLAHRTRVMGAPATPTTKLGPGQGAIVWLDVAIDRPADGSPAAIPTELSHSIDLTVAQPMPPLFPATITETVAPVTVSTRKPAVIAPPLDGPNWFDANGCCDMSAHRMAMNPLDGELWAAERHAIDYVQLQPDGRLLTGDPSTLDSYHYFGADIHAVADGPVVAVVDGLPEQIPGTKATGLSLGQYGGNHVVQDIGGGNYAFYAHLKPGSPTVRVGDRVKSGQVIAALGNTGNSDAPHLHFQVMSTPDPLRSDGLPFVISSFKLDSRIASDNAVDEVVTGQPAPLQPGFTPRDETGVTPLDLDVMTYATG